jgi:hypothetical protein
MGRAHAFVGPAPAGAPWPPWGGSQAALAYWQTFRLTSSTKKLVSRLESVVPLK